MYFCHVCQQFHNQQDWNETATQCAVCHSPLIEAVEGERHREELQALARPSTSPLTSSFSAPQQSQRRQGGERDREEPRFFLEDVLQQLGRRLAEGGDHIHIQLTFAEDAGGPGVRPRRCVSLDEMMASLATMPDGLRESDRADHPEAFTHTSCPICLDSLLAPAGPVVVLPCRHCFHRGCIKRWLREHDDCPLCRTTVDSPQPTPSPSRHVNN